MRFSPRAAVTLLAGGHLMNDFYCNFLPVLLPIIMPKLDLSLTLSGLLVMVMSIASNMMQPVFGYLMDRHRMSWLLVPVLPFGALCSSMRMISSSPTVNERSLRMMWKSTPLREFRRMARQSVRDVLRIAL